ERAGTPLSKPQKQQAIMQMLNEGSSDQKMHSISLLAIYARALLADPKASDDAKKAAGSFAESVARLVADKSPAVSLWAKYSLVPLYAPAQKAGIINQLSSDEWWVSRLLALTATPGLPPDVG